MADPVFTLATVGRKYLGDVLFAFGTLTSDGGTYAAGGFVVTPTFESMDLDGRSPDLVVFQANLTANGYRYDYDTATKKLIIRVATTAGTNAIEAEHTAAAVVAAARTGAKWFAIWFPRVPPNTDRSTVKANEV
jgi:hypothetical protein